MLRSLSHSTQCSTYPKCPAPRQEHGRRSVRSEFKVRGEDNGGEEDGREGSCIEGARVGVLIDLFEKPIEQARNNDTCTDHKPHVHVERPQEAPQIE